MNPLLRSKPTILPLFIASVLACFGLLPKALAVVPPPDGGYPGGNTAEGQNALFSLTTGGFNTAVGFLSLRSNTTNSFNTAIGAGTLLANTADNNTATGAGALLSNTIGGINTANGAFALFSNTTGGGNAANGYQALFSNTTSNANTANGAFALFSNTTGSGNTAIGNNALASNTTGFDNIAVGAGAGLSLTTENSNIIIGNQGIPGESSTIRIGSGQQTTFIAAIRDAQTGNANTLPVLIDLFGQLGTASSSRRFKKEIKPMDQTSEAILALKPVTFHYKSDSTGTPQFGLVAEEVAEVNSDLVVRDKNGEIYTVRYEAVNAMLLNEFLKEHRKNEEQQAIIMQLKSTDAKQEATIAKQQKQIEALTAGLQKVSDQLELSKPAPQVVNNP